MNRNKHIYALSDGAVVAHSAHGSGGTWSGATENLKHSWVPLSVLAEPPVPEGNRKRIEKGGQPVDRRLLRDDVNLEEWLFTGRSVSEIPSFVDSFGESSSITGSNGSGENAKSEENTNEPVETNGQASSSSEGPENLSGNSPSLPE
jgi:predicted Rossmann fold nucleotide-binding protein DprA/Smf involved in DNA uptake